MFAPGTLLAGKFRIERVIGQGGMGTVLAATHIHLGTQVALKFLNPDMARNQAVVERFMREARASAQLRSEHVCKVSDVGMLDNGLPYIVMDLLVGEDLHGMLRTRGAMPLAFAAELVMQASCAIAEAHLAGIVHRDLKPGNLFLTLRDDGSPLVKVLDFGVAKAPDAVNFSLTQTSSVVGSPGYMSPEQLRSSKIVDARSDIWSLGIVLYELVSARQPFLGESITELALRVALDPTPPLGGVVPGPFEAVIARCLEKDPARRFQSVAELAVALAPFAGPRGVELANAVARAGRTTSMGSAPLDRAMMATGATPPTTLRGASGVVEGAPSAGRGFWRPVGIGLGVAVAVFAGIVIVGRYSGGSGSGSGTTAPAPAAAPAPAPAAAPAPAPAPAAALAPDADAAAVAAPAPTPDAAPAPVAVTPPAPAHPAAVKKTEKPKPKVEDVGDSRY